MTPDHLAIGSFARRTGLTPSALRFYDDAGVLPPAVVDQSSGYRYYAPGQTADALLIRDLRAMGMPLADIRTALDDPSALPHLVDAQLARLERGVVDAAAAAERIRSSGTGAAVPGRFPAGTVSGPLLAAAADQVLPATVVDDDLPVLDAVQFEVAETTLALTATDRYRLASRTLQLADPAAADWSAVVSSAGVRTLLDVARRSHRVSLQFTGSEVVVAGDGDSVRVPVLDAEFPDYRQMLAALPAADTRVLMSRRALLDLLERSDRQVRLDVGDGRLDTGCGVLPAVVSGVRLTIAFDVTVLYPAVSAAIGDDVMLDLAGPDLPARVRSADDGDLLMLAMPVKV